MFDSGFPEDYLGTVGTNLYFLDLALFVNHFETDLKEIGSTR